MRIAPAMLLLISVFTCARLPVCAGTASAAMETTDFAGKRYVRVADWARVNNLDVRWLERDQSLALTNRSLRIVLQKDSKNAELNGVNVLLCYPIVLNNGAGYIAEADLQKTLAPLLYAPANTAGTHIRTIVIDPGHGGKDPGFQVGSYQEKKYTLLLAQELRDQLKRAGFNVSLTRTRDTYMDKSLRPGIAKKRGADLFISLHWNSTSVGKNDVKGVQTYCLTPAGAASSNTGDDVSDVAAKVGNQNDRENILLGYDLQRALIHDLGTEDRGLRRARFTVLCGAEMPAVLIEGGYMSHPAESKQIYDAGYRRRMATAIVSGVLMYKRQVEPPPPPPVRTATNVSSAPAGPRSNSAH